MESFKLGKCKCGCRKDIPLRTKRGYLAKYVNGHSRPKVKYNCGKCKDQNWIITCKCGCNELLFFRDKFYEIREFVFGHAIRTRDQTGENNANWKGGKYYNPVTSYCFTRRPDHPFQNNGYVASHRLIMEKYLSELAGEEVYIPSELDVHHKNEIKTDNRIENLEILEHGEHTIAHNEIDMSDRRCYYPNCKTPYETGVNKETGRPHWMYNPDDKNETWCTRCWNKDYRKRNNLK
jgi:hypothetical protein